MENISITPRGNEIQIKGYSDGVKVIKITGTKSKRLSDLALHKSDLEFALQCLTEINAIPIEKWNINSMPIGKWTLIQALWRSAIIHFCKCFGDSKSRFQINPETIWKGNENAMEAFNYFKNLRNRHVIHDENSYSQSLPGAIINNGKKSYKVEKIVCLAVTGETLEQVNYSNLKLLIKTAIEWVTSQFDKLCENLTSELEKVSYEGLAAKESIKYQAPRLEDINKQRNAP